MLKKIREDRGLFQREIAEMLQVTVPMVKSYERSINSNSVVITKYINHMCLTEEEEEELRFMRKDNWSYCENRTPIANEMMRIRNGLGLLSDELSLILDKPPYYWDHMIQYSRLLTEDDLDALDRRFNLSSTTIKRVRVVRECMEYNMPVPEHYKYENPEIEEPKDLYDDYVSDLDMEAYEELESIIIEEYGSILNAPECDPKMVKLRSMLGVIYYDELEERERVAEVVTWGDVL